jgi:hypothetical protein
MDSSYFISFDYSSALIPIALGPKHDNKPIKRRPFQHPDLLIPFLGGTICFKYLHNDHEG